MKMVTVMHGDLLQSCPPKLSQRRLASNPLGLAQDRFHGSPKASSEFVHKLQSTYEKRIAEALLELKRSKSSGELSANSHEDFHDTGPTATLIVPGLEDDYYQSILTWGRDSSLFVGVRQEIHKVEGVDSENPHSRPLGLILDQQKLSAIATQPGGGELMAVATKEGCLGYLDLGHQSQRLMGTRRQHDLRIAALCWADPNVLATASKDTCIALHDIRSNKATVGRFKAHSQEVCGLTFSKLEPTMLASGGNDNAVHVWDLRFAHQNHLVPFASWHRHQAAVKALAWNPLQRGLLASGGGTADKCIHIWNSKSESQQQPHHVIETGSQVCGLTWMAGNTAPGQIVSSHGYSDNHMVLWDSDRRQGIPFYGHSQRVLHMQYDRRSGLVATAGGDQRLCLWKLNLNASKSSIAL